MTLSLVGQLMVQLVGVIFIGLTIPDIWESIFVEKEPQAEEESDSTEEKDMPFVWFVFIVGLFLIGLPMVVNSLF